MGHAAPFQKIRYLKKNKRTEEKVDPLTTVKPDCLGSVFWFASVPYLFHILNTILVCKIFLLFQVAFPLK